MSAGRGPLRSCPPGGGVSAIFAAPPSTGLSSFGPPCPAAGMHRRLGQHSEDTRLSPRIGPVTKGGVEVCVLGLPFGGHLLPLGTCVPEVDRQIPVRILRVAQQGGA